KRRRAVTIPPVCRNGRREDAILGLAKRGVLVARIAGERRASRLEDEQFFDASDESRLLATLERDARDTKLAARALEGVVMRHVADDKPSPAVLLDRNARRVGGGAGAEKVLGEGESELLRRAQRELACLGV